jgi:hypothetical protein
MSLGLGRGAISYRRGKQRLIAVHDGVYALGYVRRDPRARAAAAVLACGEGALLSHDSAAALWGMGRWPSTPEVTVASKRARPGIRIHRSRTIARRDRRRHHGIAVTSPARTALDIAPRITRRELAKAVNDAENAGYLRTRDVLEILRRLPRAPGAAALRWVAGAGDLRSPLEYDFVVLAAKHGLPPPVTNVRVAGHLVDALFAEERVIVELDSWGFHRDRVSFEDNRERDAATLTAGYITIRLTSERWSTDPQREAARLQDILDQRRNGRL